MGCAPSPEELDANRYEGIIFSSQIKFDKLKSEYERLCDFIKRIAQRNTKALTLWHEILASRTEEFKIEGRKEDNSSFYTWLGQMSVTADNNLSELQKFEILLCNARCILYVNQDLVKGLNDQSLSEEMNHQLEFYIAHRREDREDWLKWLDEELNKALRYGVSPLPQKKERTENIRVKIEEEIARVKSFTNEEVLRDCLLFGRSAADFDFYTLLMA